MKIGILTFHWATNYGAVLQTYALQQYLVDKGNEVFIINYKPSNYDFSWMSFIHHPKSFIHLPKILMQNYREKSLNVFRKKYLNLTERYFSYEEVANHIRDFDILISGSDQILNPFFTVNGEKKETSTYFLNFPNTKSKKIGYSVSFGCVEYPSFAEDSAKKFIQSFDSISVREDSGITILKQLSCIKKVIVTPDPILLLGKKLFEKIPIKHSKCSQGYTCVYMLRRKYQYKVDNALLIDDFHKCYTMEEWVGAIANSRFLITNSYHGALVAILHHVPFIVDIDPKSEINMADRFYTILSRLDLQGRIVNSCIKIPDIDSIDWNLVDEKLNTFIKSGESFLNSIYDEY